MSTKMTKYAELNVHVHHLSVGLDISSSSIVCVLAEMSVVIPPRWARFFKYFLADTA